MRRPLLLFLALSGCAVPFAKTRDVSLFNGRDLEGWTVKGDPAWRVEEGLLVCDGGGGGWLRTNAEYENFVLSLEYRLAKPGGNSGIFLRATDAGNPAFTGMEVQILGDPGAAPDLHSSSSLYGSIAPSTNASNAIGEWNEVVISCADRRLKVVVNGERVIDADLDGDHPYQERPLRERARRGFLGLQNHGDRVEFRKLKVVAIE